MTESFDFTSRPHRRHNPLTGDWVLVSPHRNQRPWHGHTQNSDEVMGNPYDKDCYLCPGNQRMGGGSNPDYDSVFVFDNDFPALTQDHDAHITEDALFRAHSVDGTCRVVAYSPDHNTTLAELPTTEVAAIINSWIDQSRELGERFDWVQIFENKGEIMGCSMPHPHGQIWAQKHTPTLLAKEDRAQANHLCTHKSNLLYDYAQKELARGERIIVSNTDWVAVVPYWAAWPFEALLLPNFKIASITQLDSSQVDSLADILTQLLIRYDNLFECSFPYSMGWHSAPNNPQSQAHWQLHAHFYPPLLRSASVRKFMVGYELLAETQRDLTPEQAAGHLRELSSVHYKHRG